MRTCVVMMALAAAGACGSETKPAGPAPQPGVGSAPAADAALPLLAGPSTVVPNARPAALAWITDAGALAVGRAKGYDSAELARAPRDNVEPDRLRRAVLAAIVADDGPHAALARIDLDDLEARAGTPEPLGDKERRLSARMVPLAAIDPTSPLVFVDPAAPATTLARSLVDTGGALAAPHASQLAILDLAFDLTTERGQTPDGWLEVHVDVHGAHAISLPDGAQVDIAVTASDAEWQAIIDRFGARTKQVDVLAGVGSSAQALIGVIASLARVGATDLAVGEARVTVEQRQLEIASMRTGPQLRVAPLQMPEAGLGKAAIQQTIRLARAKVKRCYEQQLLVDPKLRGKVNVSFWIRPDGSVDRPTAAGMHRGVSACIEDVIRELRFPKRRGLGTRVNYPFVFQSA